MSGTAAKGKGFSVSISALDNASKTIDGINKRIHALTAPAEKFNKSLGKFGEVSGIRRLSEGMKDLGHSSLDTFRSMDRIVPALGAITGAASIAGMAELVRKWAEFGERVTNTAYALNTPIAKLGAMRGALRLVGGSAEEADQGMRGLKQNVEDARWGRNPEMAQFFKQLHIDPGAPGRLRQMGDVIGDIAESIKGRDVEAQKRILERSGLGGDAWLAALKNGRKGWQDLQKDAEKTGGVMTGEMAEHAATLQRQFTTLGMAAEGLGNTIVDKLAPPIGKVVTGITNWIEKNQDLIGTKVAQWVEEFVAALEKISGWADAHPQWAGVILGALAGSRLGPGGAIVGGILGSMPGGPFQDPIKGEPGSPLADPNAPDKEESLSLGARAMRWLFGGFRSGAASQRRTDRITPPISGSEKEAVAQRTHDAWIKAGYTEEQVAGVLAAGPSAESGFNPQAVGDSGSSYGLYQHHATRWDAMAKKYHAQYPTEAQQNEYAIWEVGPEGPLAEVGERLHRAKTAPEAAKIWTSGDEMPKDTEGESTRRAAGAPSFVGRYAHAPDDPGQQNGHVKVDVTIKGPTGTTAKVDAAGAVRAPPPRVETPMVMN